jgi:hypothetical protein
MRCIVLVLSLCVGPTLATAQGLDKSLRPVARPVASLATSGAAIAAPTTEPVTARPKLRPILAAAVVPQPVAVAVIELSRPMPRPRGLASRAEERAKVTEVAVIAPPSKAMTRSKKGSVCGDASIKGEVLAPITGRVKGCGVAEPVRVTSVDGVRLSEAAIMDCTTAKALKTWVTEGLEPAFPKSKVVELRVAAHYICRSRNNQKGAKISEHGKGKAIDISAIILADGRVLTVADDWGKTMRRAYKAACGIFKTTLGPGSDGYHEDHMHFDTARHRNGGAYCR